MYTIQKAKTLLTHAMEAAEIDIIRQFAALPNAVVIDVGLEYPAVYRPAKSLGRPILVAHTDTVWDEPVKVQWKGWVGRSAYKQVGIGADDRAGTAALLALAGEDVGLLIVPLEESGCVGSRALLDSRPDAVRDIMDNHPAYFIQFDRRGATDLVFYEGDGTELIDQLSPHFPRYKEEMGSFSDVAVLAPACGIAGVNVSIGFVNEHTEQEQINANVWRITVENTRMLLQSQDVEPLDYVEDPRIGSALWDYQNYTTEPRDYDDADTMLKDNIGWTCTECGVMMTNLNPSCLCVSAAMGWATPRRVG